MYLHGRIEAAAHRISRIVKGLKKISRSSDSLIHSHRVFSNIVSEVVHLANGMMQKELITLKLDLSTDAEIECDEVEIEQVVLNLIGNAIHAIKNLTDKWIKIAVFYRDRLERSSNHRFGSRYSRGNSNKTFRSVFHNQRN